MIVTTSIAQGNTDFTPTQVSDLYGIASQCPLLGGEGVYAARALYSGIDDIAYNDDQLCAEQNVYWQEKSSLKDQTFNLLPNPATDVLTVNYPLLLQGTYTIELRDILSRVVYSSLAESHTSSMTIDLAGLQTGIYVITIKREGDVVFSDKVNIIK